MADRYKEEEILGIYAQRRKNLERKQEKNEREIRIQELKIEQLYYLDHQIKNLIHDINVNAGEKDWKFLSEIEEDYLEYYRREVDKANDEMEDMKKEKKSFAIWKTNLKENGIQNSENLKKYREKTLWELRYIHRH